MTWWVGPASANALGLDLGCFTIEYPFTLKDDRGGQHLVNDDTDFYTLFDSTTTTYNIVDYVYPITISDSTGVTTQINNIDELAEALHPAHPVEVGKTATFLPISSMVRLPVIILFTQSNWKKKMGLLFQLTMKLSSWPLLPNSCAFLCFLWPWIL